MNKVFATALSVMVFSLNSYAMMDEKEEGSSPRQPLQSTASRKISEASSVNELEKFKEALSSYVASRRVGINKIQELADENNFEAIVFLGHYYSNGTVKFNEEKALDNFNKALSITHDTTIQATLYNEIGSVFYAVDKCEDAKENYNAAIKLGSIAAQKNLDDLNKELS